MAATPTPKSKPWGDRSTSWNPGSATGKPGIMTNKQKAVTLGMFGFVSMPLALGYVALKSLTNRQDAALDAARDARYDEHPEIQMAAIEAVMAKREGREARVITTAEANAAWIANAKAEAVAEALAIEKAEVLATEKAAQDDMRAKKVFVFLGIGLLLLIGIGATVGPPREVSTPALAAIAAPAPVASLTDEFGNCRWGTLPKTDFFPKACRSKPR